MVCVMLPILVPVFVCLAYAGKLHCEKESEERYLKIELFQKFEQSYRPNFFWWESYRLVERLLVAAVVTFVINPVERLMILSPIFVMITIFHYLVNPYKRSLKLVKTLDLFSNAFLCLMLIVNIFRADVFTHNLSYQFPVDKVSKMVSYFEYIFSPWWIFIICFFINKFTKNE